MDWSTEAVNTIYTSNDGYAGYLAASLYSLLDNNRNIPWMDMYILSVGMSEAYLERLTDIAGTFCRGLHVTEPGNLREWSDHEVDTRGFGINAMGHLSAPKALPDCVGKTLYLNYDTIIDGSIRLLYEAELGSHLVGVVTEPTAYREIKGSIGMERGEPYYNSGVLLIDLETWRDQGVPGQLLEFYRSHEDNLPTCNQDTINEVLRGRIMSLLVRYSYFTNYRYFRYRTLAPTYGAYRLMGEDKYRQAGKAPVIIHHLGDERPWITGDHNHFRRLHEYYLDEAPWKGTPKQKRKRLYIQVWWVFNHVNLVCPAFRLWINRRLGMKLVDSHRRQKIFGSGKWYE